MSRKTSVRRGAVHSVLYGKRQINFRLTYTDSSRLTISVHPDKQVTVKAPLDKCVEEIVARVQRRGNWILKQWRHFDKFLPLPKAKLYVSGETHLYLGRRYRLRVRHAKEESVKLTRGFIWVRTPSPKSRDRVRKLATEWYANRARVVFERRMQECQTQASKIGIVCTEFSIRQMTSRWGSCSKGGRITLNTDLIQAPRECIDYIILHELCHLRHKNHTAAFWKLLERVVPDWKKRKEKLERGFV